VSRCIFCDIVAGAAPARIVYRDERVVAFHDVAPRAPVHLLIVPVEHLDSLNDLTAEHAALAGHLLLAAQRLAEQHHLARSGYRVVINTGRGAGQIVFHLHLHLMSGGSLRSPLD